ncbi:MAG TPA: aminotransferase class III-fold pyridoxal phosphate-dependent enzyme [Vicinamibacterales bacterium]|nr:aminotransferase class III-fold pyridoxal phosphate-dependent enzyme [Vicinamibacterales bacterium]
MSEVQTTYAAMTGEEIVALARKHTLFEWAAQGAVDPLPVARAQGVHFWTPDGRRYLDFNSQLMCVNIGHGHPHVVRAIAEQAERLAYVSPFMATEPRARLGAKLAAVAPGDIDAFFFTTGGADANEHAIKIAKLYTGRPKILARYRSYHGATTGAATLTGDPRRWPFEPGLPGVVHVLDAYHGIERGWEPVDQALARLEETIELEGPKTIAAFILEPVTGTNGILVPPDGYLQGVREICTRHGILLIADEVMSGFGRTGEWFAVDHWRVVPDILTMAKGLTSGYVPLGAVGVRREIAEFFRDRVLWSGLTYNSHPLACAAAVATLEVYEREDLIANARRMGAVMRALLADLESRHSIVGAVRSIGLFGIVELVEDRRSRRPLAPFGGTSEPMQRLARFFRDNGLYTFVRWHTFFTNPPLCITEADLREGFEIIDRALAAIAP